jgi:hypothetical protein
MAFSMAKPSGETLLLRSSAHCIRYRRSHAIASRTPAADDNALGSSRWFVNTWSSGGPERLTTASRWPSPGIASVAFQGLVGLERLIDPVQGRAKRL